jgi:hypothetical protein
LFKKENNLKNIYTQGGKRSSSSEKEDDEDEDEDEDEEKTFSNTSIGGRRRISYER